MQQPEKLCKNGHSDSWTSLETIDRYGKPRIVTICKKCRTRQQVRYKTKLRAKQYIKEMGL